MTAAPVVDRGGHGDPLRQGGHREWRSAEPEDSHQDQEGRGVRGAPHGQDPEDSSPSWGTAGHAVTCPAGYRSAPDLSRQSRTVGGSADRACFRRAFQFPLKVFKVFA